MINNKYLYKNSFWDHIKALLLAFVTKQAISSWSGQIWKRRLAKYLPELCGDENTHSSGKPCTKVLHSSELNEQRQKAGEHP